MLGQKKLISLIGVSNDDENLDLLLAAAVSFVLASQAAYAVPVVPLGQGLIVQVRHHKALPHRIPPTGSLWITTPGLSAGANSSRTYNSYQSYGASPGQPGSPTYAPYAGLPPLRYYGN